MSLHLSRMRRNVNRKVYKDRKNVSATPSLISYADQIVLNCTQETASGEDTLAVRREFKNRVVFGRDVVHRSERQNKYYVPFTPIISANGWYPGSLASGSREV